MWAEAEQLAEAEQQQSEAQYAADLQEVREVYAAHASAAAAAAADQPAGDADTLLAAKDAEIKSLQQQLRDLGKFCEMAEAAATGHGSGEGVAPGSVPLDARATAARPPDEAEEGIPPETS